MGAAQLGHKYTELPPSPLPQIRIYSANTSIPPSIPSNLLDTKVKLDAEISRLHTDNP